MPLSGDGERRLPSYVVPWKPFASLIPYSYFSNGEHDTASLFGRLRAVRHDASAKSTCGSP